MTLISLSWSEDSNPNPSQQIQQAYEHEYAYINETIQFLFIIIYKRIQLLKNNESSIAKNYIKNF